MKLHEKLMAQMRAATQRLRNGGAVDATAVIQEALKGLTPQAGAQPWTAPANSNANSNSTRTMHDINPPPSKHAATEPEMKSAAEPQAEPQFESNQVHLDKMQNFVPDLLAKLGIQTDLSGLQGNLPSMPAQFDMASFKSKFGQGVGAEAEDDASVNGQFIAGSYTNQAGTRAYKLYIPSSYHDQSMPLIVMLHGCTQNPDDFAFGTRMNALAEEKQCLVVYPMQNQTANSSKCWNWFSAIDQQRGQGEASIIAGITQQVIQQYGCDPAQIYVAGLSAGGAMAVIMGSQYPDLYAAVGVHSGLPYASAHDLPSALAAMQGNAEPGARATSKLNTIPIIVFHGDRDTTVHPRNGEQVLAQSLPRVKSGAGDAKAQIVIQRGSVPQGHAYTRKTHHDNDGQAVAEHWLIHGAGHAWSGGSARGSYTDGKGPDATLEMMRFFSTQVKANSNSTV
ncbi:MAG: PHB depolymerase family esterase [Pseudomonadota bacterium]